MPRIPLPKSLWESNDESTINQSVGSQMFDFIFDNQNNYVKRPGLKSFCDLGVNSSIDGLFYWSNQDLVIAISGGNIYKITRDGTYTDITNDTLVSGAKVSFATDGNIVAATNGENVVAITTATSDDLTDGDAPTSVDYVIYFDTYMIVNNSATRQWYFSEVGATWSKNLAFDPLDFYSAEAMPDNLVAIHASKKLIYLLGESSVEVWYNDGVSPFSRADNHFVTRGTIQHKTSVVINEALYFLDSDLFVTRIFGGQSERISPAIDVAIENLTHPNSCYAFHVNVRGKDFYILTFDLDNVTFVFDVVNQSWSRWGYWNSTTGSWDRFLGNCSCLAGPWGKTFIGSRSDGIIYELDLNTHTDDGNTIRSLIRTAPIVYDNYDVKNSKFLVFRCKRGVGPTTTEPVFEFRWNTDNKGWGYHRQISLGTVNDKDIFTKKFGPMGQYTSRQYEIVHSAASHFELLSIEEDLEVLPK